MLPTTIGTNILANLSPTMFQAGPKDVVAAPDVYSINSNSVLNTTIGRFSSFDGSSILGSFQQSPTGFLSSITSMAASALGGGYSVNFASANVQSRLQSAAGQPMGSLTDTVQNLVAQSVLSLASSFTQAEFTVGGVSQLINVVDYESTANTVQLANQLSGDSNLITISDVGATSAVLTAVTGQLLAMGLSSAVSSLITSTGGTAATATKTALQANVQQAISASDLSTIQLCITQLGVGGVLQQVPNAALSLMKGYRLPAGTLTTGYAALAITFLGIINQLAPGWDTYIRNGQSVTNLTFFSQASPDAVTLLKTQSGYQIPCLIAHSYPPQDTLTALRQEYPTAVTL